MLEYVIPLLGSFLIDSLVNVYLFPVLALMFLATVPPVLRSFWR